MRVTPILFFLLIVISCSPKFKIQSDTPFQGDFNNYNSFKFYNPDNMPSSNFSFEDEDREVIFDAVAVEMKARGYKSIQDADLMIKIQGGTKSAVEIKNDDRYYPNNYNQYGYDRYGRYNDNYSRNNDRSEKDASIIIDLIDIKKDKIVWHVVGSGALGKNETLTEIKIREVISNIFKEYPHNTTDLE